MMPDCGRAEIMLVLLIENNRLLIHELHKRNRHKQKKKNRNRCIVTALTQDAGKKESFRPMCVSQELRGVLSLIGCRAVEKIFNLLIAEQG